jgi:hypothetical protein
MVSTGFEEGVQVVRARVGKTLGKPPEGGCTSDMVLFVFYVGQAKLLS